MALPIFPMGLQFREWASQIRTAYPLLYFPRPLADPQWRFWAAQVVIGNTLPQHVYPTHLAFPDKEDWRKWSAYFINTISGG